MSTGREEYLALTGALANFARSEREITLYFIWRCGKITIYISFIYNRAGEIGIFRQMRRYTGGNPMNIHCIIA